MNRRRAVLALLTFGASPLLSHAQAPTKIPRIGVLWHAGSEQEEAIYLGALRRGLKDLGYAEGTNIVLENRFPAEQPERFVSYANELAQLRVDVLVAVTPRAALAAQKATTTIPIVFIYVPDPVKDKLVDSLSRPGGLITGLSSLTSDINLKRIQLLKEAVPNLTRVALLARRGTVSSISLSLEEMVVAAKSLNLTPLTFEVSRADELEGTFVSMTKERANGVVVLPDGLFYVERRLIANMALKHRLPSVYSWSEAAESGGLMSYGPDFQQIAYRAAYYIDKVLKGTKPGDLPVELPTKFELVFNVKTAKALGLSVPQSFLIRADRVVE